MRVISIAVASARLPSSPDTNGRRPTDHHISNGSSNRAGVFQFQVGFFGR